MNFSAMPNNLTGKFLRSFLRLIPAKAQVRILQGKLKGQKWIVGSGVHGCWLGSYELEKQQLFEKTIQAGKVVFDLGANVGFYTLLSSVLVGSKGKVVAFEPLPRNLVFLRQHMSINHVDNVTIMDAAVSDTTGTITFDTGPHSSMGKIAENGTLKVTTVVLDTLFEMGEIPAPDYMKIDIEGAELMALQGATRVLDKYHPTIFLATHGKEVHQKCLEFLTSLGYTLRSINEKNLEETDEVIADYR